MNEIEKLLKVLKSQEELCHEKIEIVKGTCNTYIKIKPIIQALEKQTPKNPLEIKEKHNFHGDVILKDGYCPICKNEMSSASIFCNKCGQAMDWSAEE